MGATAAVAAVVAGGVLQASGQAKAGKYQEQIAFQNAAVMDAQAADALRRGRIAAGRQRQQTRGLIGAQRASFGAQGIDMSSGSAADLQADAAKFGELDALTILQNAALEDWALRTQATSTRFQGNVAAKLGRQQAYATLLNTGGSVLSKKYGFG